MKDIANLCYIMRWDAPRKNEVQTRIFRDFSEEEKQVMDCFEKEQVVNIDEIIVKTDLSPTKLAALLLTLEFDGILMSLPGKRYQRC